MLPLQGKLCHVFSPVTAFFHRLSQRRPTKEDVVSWSIIFLER